MNHNMQAWVVKGTCEPRQMPMREAAASGDDFFLTEAEAWEWLAERERGEAAHKQLGANEATNRARRADARAKALRDAKPEATT